MKYLFAVASLMVASMPVQAETAYLLIKSARNTKSTGGVALHSIPMESLDQCEEAGGLIVASERFELKYASEDSFECIIGK